MARWCHDFCRKSRRCEPLKRVARTRPATSPQYLGLHGATSSKTIFFTRPSVSQSVSRSHQLHWLGNKQGTNPNQDNNVGSYWNWSESANDIRARGIRYIPLHPLPLKKQISTRRRDCKPIEKYYHQYPKLKSTSLLDGQSLMWYMTYHSSLKNGMNMTIR